MAEMDYDKYSPFSEREGKYLDARFNDDALATGDSTCSRREIPTSAVPTVSGNLRLTYFTATKSETVGTVRYTVGSVSAGATPTLCRIGLYIENPDLSLTLVASTPNDTALFSGGTFFAYTKALSSPYNKISGQRYAIGVLIVTAAATPNLYGQNNIGSILFAEPKLTASGGAQSDLPATVASGSLSASGYLYYLEILP